MQSPVREVEERTLLVYPRAFDKLFSLQHFHYMGWLAAIHGTYWGLIFAWTTFFGILRDGGSYKQMFAWLIGFLLFVDCAMIIWKHFEHVPSMRILLWNGYIFFSGGMICTLTAGPCARACAGPARLPHPPFRGPHVQE